MLGFKFSSEFQGIPTREEWVGYTTGTLVHHRGPELMAIDLALHHYHQTMASPSFGYGGLKAAVTKIKIVTLQLCSLINACEAWLTAKKQSWEIGFSSRAPLVRRLAAQALDKVNVLRPEDKGFNAETPATYLNIVAADIRWRMILPLIHDWQAGKQLANLNIMESNPSGVNPEHYIGEGIVKEFNKQEEFAFLFDFIRKAQHNVERIMYLHEDHRWPHQILICDGLAYRVDRKGDRTEIRATGGGNLLISQTTRRIYFINKDVMATDLEDYDVKRLQPKTGPRRIYFEKPHTPRIIARPDPDGFSTKHTEFRHSTFLAGEPCLFAGAMTIDEAEPGRIVQMDNLSGHYQPTPKQLIDAIELMNETGTLDLTKIKISVGMHCPGLVDFVWNGKPLMNGDVIMTADIPCGGEAGLWAFQTAVKAQQKSYYEMGVDLELKFTPTQLLEARALGVIGLEAVDPNYSRREPDPGPSKIRTDVNFF